MSDLGRHRFIGDFRLVRKLGEGGMGIVYEAEQQHPRRPVALKVVRGGPHVSPETLKLFQREAQTLARLRHPGIAQLYETGATEDGLHYFAMELVRGSTLTAWTGRRPAGPVTPDELKIRLSVFRRICDAVAYAHQKGVIHRDLKPGNVLIPAAPLGSSMPDPVPDVKVLDFGLARMTDADVQRTTFHTEMGKVRGTLPYMSPEQVRGNPDEIDQRTDVYSLGVILYELVAGDLPYDLGKAQLPEAVRVICEQPPRSLSTMVSGKRLPDDVVTIVGKCLEKAPARRYQSVAALGEDVGRFLSDQPIQARPPSAAYQLRKLMARHRGPFAFAATVFVLVALLAVGSSVQAVRLSRERDRAAEEAATAREVSEFLEGIFKTSDPSESRGEQITAGEILERGAEEIERELSDQPVVQARLLLAMGRSYGGLWLHERAEPLLRKALDIRRARFGEDSVEVAEVLSALGSGEVAQPPGERREMQERALTVFRAHLPPHDPRIGWAGYHLGVALFNENRLDEARRSLEAALEVLRVSEGEDSRAVIWCHNDLGNVLLNSGDLEGALEHQEAALAIRRRTLTVKDRDLAIGLNNVAEVLMQLGRYDRARRLAEEAVASAAVSLGTGDSVYGFFMNTLAEIQRRSGDLAAADRTLDVAVPLCRRTLDPKGTYWSEVLLTYARVHRDLGHHEEAEKAFLELLPILEDTHREAGPTRLKEALEDHAVLLRATGRLAAALETESRARAIGLGGG